MDLLPRKRGSGVVSRKKFDGKTRVLPHAIGAYFGLTALYCFLYPVLLQNRLPWNFRSWDGVQEFTSYGDVNAQFVMENVMKKQSPAVFRGIMNRTQDMDEIVAFANSFDRMQTELGDQGNTVETATYEDRRYGKSVSMTAEEFFRDYKQGRRNSYMIADDHIPKTLAESNWPEELTCILEYWNRDDVVSQTWLSAGGTDSVTHHDSENQNFYLQLRGGKTFHIAEPRNMENLYWPEFAEEYWQQCSQVRYGHPDATKYPRYEQVKFHTIRLEPGDMIYLPQFTYVKRKRVFQPNYSLKRCITSRPIRFSDSIGGNRFLELLAFLIYIFGPFGLIKFFISVIFPVTIFHFNLYFKVLYRMLFVWSGKRIFLPMDLSYVHRYMLASQNPDFDFRVSSGETSCNRKYRWKDILAGSMMGTVDDCSLYFLVKLKQELEFIVCGIVFVFLVHRYYEKRKYARGGRSD